MSRSFYSHLVSFKLSDLGAWLWMYKYMCWTVDKPKTISCRKHSCIQLIWFPLVSANFIQYWRCWETRWEVINFTLYRQSLFVPIIMLLVLQLYFWYEPLSNLERWACFLGSNKPKACSLWGLPWTGWWTVSTQSGFWLWMELGTFNLAELISHGRLSAIMDQESKPSNRNSRM